MNNIDCSSLEAFGTGAAVGGVAAGLPVPS